MAMETGLNPKREATSTVETLPQDIPTRYPDSVFSEKTTTRSESVPEKVRISSVSGVFDILKYKVLIPSKIQDSKFDRCRGRIFNYYFWY